jgi:hypothetical protein
MTKRRWKALAFVFAVGVIAPATQALAVYACGDGSGPASTYEPPASSPSHYATADFIDAEANGDREWADYQATVVEPLGRSADPRDWALAAVVGQIRYTMTPAAVRVRLASGLARAAAAAPDDALVQWLAMTMTDEDGGKRAARQKLQQRDSRNVAVWLADLDEAVLANNASAVDVALTKMAASDRIDGHFADLVHALTLAYRRVPAPLSLFAAWPDDEAAQLREVLPLSVAIVHANAIAIPGFQNLLNACRVNAATGQNSQRAGDCATIGRMLVSRGDTLVANRIGSSLLRVSRAFSDSDVEAARALDWTMASYAPLASEPPTEHSVERMQRYVDDWIETGREIEAMRRALAREHLASTRPAGWDGPYPSFTGERLRADAEYFERRPVANQFSIPAN